MGNTAGVIERSRNCLHFTSIWVHPRSFGGVRVAHIFSFCVVQLCFFLAFWVLCYGVRYNFSITTMFCSPLPPVVVGGLMSYLRYLCLLAHSGVQHILWCVLCTLCCHSLWVVHFWFPLRYSLTFIARCRSRYKTDLAVSVVSFIASSMG